jgi:excisionase family DNA binding protein
MSQGNTVTLHSTNEQLSTQAAANYLNCSRPHLVKLLETGKIPMTKVGKHRRVQLRHLIEWKEQSKREQKEALTQMMRNDEELGLY